MRLPRIRPIIAAGLVLLGAAGTPRLAAQRGGALPPVVTNGAPGVPAGTPGTPTGPALGRGAISGVVLDATTNNPVAGAVVSLSSVTGRALSTGQTRQVTDIRGRFAFLGLGEWQFYTVTAGKAGYFDGAYGRPRPSNQSAPIALSDGQWFGDAKITIWRAASVSGRVLDELGEPVVGVFVRVLAQLMVAGQARLAAGPLTTTDDRGAYRVGGLGAGRYLVQVPSVQSSVPAGTSPAALAGTTPEAAARNGQTIPAETALDLDTTARLVLNKYPVPPPSADGRTLAYPIAFHPNTFLVAQATAIDLKYGEDRANVDVRLEPMATSKISGVVQGPPDSMAGVTLRLLPAGLEDLGQGSEAATALLAPDGSFLFLNVAPGNYTILTARTNNEYTYQTSIFSASLPGPPGRPGSSSTGNTVDSGPPGTAFWSRSAGVGSTPSATWARLPVSVGAGRDTSGLVVALQRPVTISGRLVFEPADPSQPGSPPQVSGLRAINAEPATGAAWLAAERFSLATEPDPGSFIVEGLMAGEYVLKGTAAAPWRIKSIVSSGRDVTYAPIDLTGGGDVTGVVATFTNATTELRGTTQTAQGAVAAGAGVIVFPVEREQWTKYGIRSARIKAQPASSTGEFRFMNLPAGSYYAVAVPAADLDAWQDPAFFQRAVAGAQSVTIAWGDRKGITLQVVAR